MDRNVVITGIGVLSSIGTGKETYWEHLFRGTSGVRQIGLFDTTSFQVHKAGELTDFDPLPYLGKKGLRDLDRSTRLICSAAKLALDDSRLEITEANTHDTGIAVGTTFGSLHSISQFDRSGLIDGPRLVNPSHFPNTVINSPASQVAIRFTLKGFNTTISTGFCAGLDAIAYASDFIRMGRAQAVIAGGVEELCEETFLLFHTQGCLSGMSGTEPASCPFDAGRDGFILSEGAAMLVLEEEEHAVNRGANILATVLGYGNAFDPDSDSTFNKAGKGLRSAIEQALADACCKPQDIDHVCACANGTQGLDRMETRVLRDVFGGHIANVPVSAIKSMLGETYSASGAMAIAAAVGALQGGWVPPTMNYSTPDPHCDLDCVPNSARQRKVGKVLITAADPYGQNAAVILGAKGR